MKKKVLSSVFAIIVIASAVFVCHKTLNGKTTAADLMLNEDIEAMAFGESLGGYSNTHIPCYDVVYYNGSNQTIPNGEVQGICWSNPYSNKACHSHNCMICNSLP